MAFRSNNFLNLTALMEAKEKGQLDEALKEQIKLKRPGLSAESYCMKLQEMAKTAEVSGLSVKDVKRREFHTNY